MPKTTTARVAELRKRRAALGLKRLEVYAHPDDHLAIKAYAAVKHLRPRPQRRCGRA